MILVVGGRGSGKRRFVTGQLGHSETDIAPAVLDSRPVLADLHLLLREYSGDDDTLLEALRHKEVVICDEIGCGIVPMTAADRAWRDRVGRVSARVAAEAGAVVRLCCGIPQYLKGTPKSRMPDA